MPDPELSQDLRAGIHELYAELGRELDRRRPVCELSGRCCRFEEYGHTLFLSSIEARLLVDEAPPPARPLDAGASCPWQDLAGRCTARDARPLGCRLYYCDPGFQEEMPELSETWISRLKALVDRHGLPWHYAPLHAHLRRLLPERPPDHDGSAIPIPPISRDDR
ncbi:MAG: hypothetical protein SFX72_19245 [Isosphaeraceae bacterium]|nr:hypothetical protein [Isosphaeraceae bacterium]